MKGSGRSAELVVDALNRGETQLPESLSVVPFVFDGEIIVSRTSVSRIWNGFVDVGFTVTNPVITSISPIILEDYNLFRNSWEMETFFKNKIPKYAYKISVDGISGELLLLFYRQKNSDYSLFGMKADAK